MRAFRDPDEGNWEKDVASFAVGAVGGLAIGILLSRTLPEPRGLGHELRERARTAARRLRPARLRRLAVEQGELDQLEDSVLRAFLEDSVLSERGVDIGAISVGIVELSGSVWSEAEADRAVHLANRIPGVRTVVNRIDIEEQALPARSPFDDDKDRVNTYAQQSHQGGGMGRRRQGRETDPDRFDDSQPRKEEALAAADRQQFVDEGFAHEHSRTSSRPEVQEANRTHFDEDELDNQDPHGKNAAYTLDSPPEELNSDARVGEGMKPGVERRLEEADLSPDSQPHRDHQG